MSSQHPLSLQFLDDCSNKARNSGHDQIQLQHSLKIKALTAFRWKKSVKNNSGK